MNTSIGKTIKKLRKERQLSQFQLAEKAGLTQSYITRIENDAKTPSIEALESLALALGASVADIIPHPAPSPAKSRKPTPPKGAGTVLGNYTSPWGLRELASDTALMGVYNVTDHDLQVLASVELPGTVSKWGYTQLLVTIRAISAAESGVTES